MARKRFLHDSSLSADGLALGVKTDVVLFTQHEGRLSRAYNISHISPPGSDVHRRFPSARTGRPAAVRLFDSLSLVGGRLDVAPVPDIILFVTGRPAVAWTPGSPPRWKPLDTRLESVSPGLAPSSTSTPGQAATDLDHLLLNGKRHADTVLVVVAAILQGNPRSRHTNLSQRPHPPCHKLTRARIATERPQRHFRSRIGVDPLACMS
jgi:hypothetical protein